jgi:hypothetical protein
MRRSKSTGEGVHKPGGKRGEVEFDVFYLVQDRGDEKKILAMSQVTNREFCSNLDWFTQRLI